MTMLRICGIIRQNITYTEDKYMIDFLMIFGFILLFVVFPASIILTTVFAIKKKKKVIFSAIGIPASFFFALAFLGIGGYLYGQTDAYKEQMARQEIEQQKTEEQKRIDLEKREREEQESTEKGESIQNINKLEEQGETESKEEIGESIKSYEAEQETESIKISQEEKTVEEMTEEEYKEQCEELWYDDIFFSEDNLEGHHVRLEIYIEEGRYFEKFPDQTTIDFINEYNLKRDLFACGVSRGEPNSYVGGQISVYFSDDYGYKQSDCEIGQELIIYGEIVEYSTNTWDGYNVCGVIPRYIEEK